MRLGLRGVSRDTGALWKTLWIKNPTISLICEKTDRSVLTGPSTSL